MSRGTQELCRGYGTVRMLTQRQRSSGVICVLGEVPTGDVNVTYEDKEGLGSDGRGDTLREVGGSCRRKEECP